MKQSSRAWILLILGIFLCASLFAGVREYPEVSPEHSMGLAPRSTAPSTPNQPTLPQIFRTDVAFAYNAYDPSGTYPEGTITFELETPGTITQLEDQSTVDFIADSSTDINGTWWGLVYGTNELATLDTETGARTVVATVTAPGGRSWTGLAYDFTEMEMYAVCTSSSVDMALCTIDLDTYEVTLIGTNTTSTLPITLACDNDGQLYAVDIVADGLFTIDKTDGSATLVATLDVNANYAQDMEFDHEDNTLYWAAYTTAGELRTINVADATTDLIGAFPGGMEVTGFAIPSVPADPGAPAAPTNFVLTPNAGGALSCVIGWTNPTHDVSGATLTELSEVRVLRNGTVVYTDNNPTIGGNASWTDTGMTASGLFNYQVLGVNSFGEGLPVNGNAWVGEDVPAAVTNLTLINNNFSGRLTWTNPTTGLHGGAFNNAVNGYHIVRNDGAEFDVTGSATLFDDETITSTGTYMYQVTTVNAIGEGGSATSNAALIATPGMLLYEEFNEFPAGWYTEDIGGPNWNISETNNAGGIAPEGILNWSPSFEGIGRLCTYEINTAGAATLDLEFKHYLNDYAGEGYTLGVATSSDGTTWNDVWTIAPTESVGPETIELTLDNTDVGSETFQICFYLSGNSFNINYWYIDDVILEGELNPGTITGTVTLNGGPGVMTEVEISASGLIVHPNQDGTYELNISEGTYDVSAYLFGYDEVTVEGVNVVEGEVTANIDFNLNPLPNVTLTGRCVGSDYPDVGLENVQIDITGYDTYQGFTDANGYFTIEGVWANHTYQITAMVEGYDIYVGEAIVGGSDTDLGDIILPEIASPPYGLIATQNNDGTEAYLIWNAPSGSIETFYNFDTDDGEFVSNDTAGWQWGEDAGAGSYSEPNVWGTALNAEYIDSASWTLDSPEIMVATEDYQLTFWQYYDTENSYDGGNIKVSIDGGANWTVINPVGDYPDDAITGLAGEPGFTDGPSGWVLATFELAAYSGEEVMFRWHFGTDTSVHGYPGWFIDDVRVGMPEDRLALQQDNDHLRWVRNENNRTDRLLENFYVYRLLLGQEDMEDQWVLINDAVSDTTYTDGTWADADQAIYKYAVKAQYTNGVMSDAAISDWLAKDYYTTCTVNVISATGDPLDGTVVSLDCQGTDPDGVHPAYEIELAEGNTTAYFPMVWLGTYELTVTLEGSEPFTGVYEIVSPTTIDVTITELTPPINGLTGTVTGNDVTLEWRTPSASTEYDFDNDNGDFVSNNTAGWQWGEDATAGSHSEPNVWGTILNGNYDDSMSLTLDSPEITIGGDNVLTFWHYYDTENSYDGGNVKISVDGGSTWTVINPVGDYPDDAITGLNGEPGYTDGPSGWVQATFDLEAYSGEMAMFRWHFGTDSSVSDYIGWYIDDVYVGTPQDRSAGTHLTRNNASRTDRSLEGYTVYRNGTMIDDTLAPADTVYVDMDLADGVYTYDIVANFTTGDSDPTSITVQVYPLNVIGYVNASDDLDNGLDGAVAVLENEDFYFESTTVDGDFSFLDVNGMQTYTLTITYESTSVFYEPYTTELVVTDADIDLGTITLIEQTPAPGDVIAEENSNQTEVELTWGTPGTGTLTEFRYDDGTITGQLGYGSGGDDVRLGACHYHDARIEEVTWYLTGEGGPHTAVDIYIYGLDGTGMPDSGDELFSQTGVANTDLEWNLLELPSPVDAPNGFFIAVNYPAGFCGIGTDDGTGDPYPYIPGTQLVTNAASTNDWHDPEEYGYPLNFSIRANGYDYGEINYRSQTVANHQGAKKIQTEAPIWIGGFTMDTNKTRSSVVKASREEAAVFGTSNNNSSITRDRSLEGYEVYRFESENINDPSQWTLLTTTPVVDTTYTDTGWDGLPSGEYQWGVRAVYTNNNYSDFSYSNIIPRSMTTTVVVNVTANTEESTQGAVLTLTNIDGNEDHVYEAVVPASGTVTFPVVWLGLYTMNCELAGYDTYNENNVVVEDLDGEEFDIELEETLISVVTGSGQVDGNDIYLTWMAPGQGGGEDFSENFEDGAIPTGWTVLDEDGDTYSWEIVDSEMGAHDSDYAIGSASYINGVGALSPDNWLITPQVEIGANSSLSFWVAAQDADWPQEHYVVRVSTSGASPNDFTEDVYESTLVDGDWHQVTVDLGDFAGNNVYIAFNHCDVTDMYWMKLDDIELTAARETITLGSGTRNAAKAQKDVATNDRSFLGYRISRNGTTIVELQSDTEYFDMNMPSGNWTYNIYAVYSTGEADPLILGPFVGTNGGTVNEYVTGLNGNYPNPFNPETKINFSLATAEKVTIEIYNVKGQKVKTLVNDKYDAGNHQVVWNGTDDTNRSVGSGIFFYKMKSGRYTATKKMILLK